MRTLFPEAGSYVVNIGDFLWKPYCYFIKMQEVGQVGQIEDSVGNRKSILFRIINLNGTSSREPENRESEHEQTSFYQQL